MKSVKAKMVAKNLRDNINATISFDTGEIIHNTVEEGAKVIALDNTSLSELEETLKDLTDTKNCGMLTPSSVGGLFLLVTWRIRNE